MQGAHFYSCPLGLPLEPPGLSPAPQKARGPMASQPTPSPHLTIPAVQRALSPAPSHPFLQPQELNTLGDRDLTLFSLTQASLPSCLFHPACIVPAIQAPVPVLQHLQWCSATFQVRVTVQDGAWKSTSGTTAPGPLVTD